MAKESMALIEVGDLVLGEYNKHGIVLKIDVNMWGEETVPSGVEILWSDSVIDIYPEDEIAIARRVNMSDE
tara:strand:- start:19 stop:231 length:213 start_codon:yes stop_codon:yes gene_type:complete